MGAGGGAGGVLSSTFTADINTSYSISVGGGGAGSFGSNGAGSDGGPTTAFGLTALGGGGGGQWWAAARSGGSGGGGGNNGGGQAGAAGSSPQGNNGGNGSPYVSPGATAAGGGGGRGSVGGNASGGSGGSGGTGFSSSITGTALFYAGGGGGGATDGNRGIGGSGVGGNGGLNSQNGSPGATNRGGGGGGASDRRTGSFSGGNGGSGVVILRYPENYGTFSTGLNLTKTIASGSTDKVATILSGAGNISWVYAQNFDGSTELKAAPSADFLRKELNITTSGNYWIKPIGYSGTAKLLWCDMTNLGGGWVLIGKGRASTDNNSGWFGTNNELSVTGLQQANAFAAGISKVDQEFVNRLMNGTTSGWTNSNPNNYMVVNRINNATDGFSGIGDSYFHKVTNQAQFLWVNQFGSTPTDNAIQSGTGINRRYPGIWLTGAQTAGDASNFIDNDFGSGNGTARLFTWHWSGHGALHGWSSGASEFRGQQNGSEGHALQFVQLWAR
jgi:hypothetical protein